MKHIKIFENFEEGDNYFEEAHEVFEFDSFEFDSDINENLLKDVLGTVLIGPLYWSKEIYQKSKDLWNTDPILSKIKDTLVKKGAVTLGKKSVGSGIAKAAGSGIAKAAAGAKAAITKKAALSPKEFDNKVIESILDSVKDRGEALMAIRNYTSVQLKLSMVNKKTKKEVSYDQWKKEMAAWKKEREDNAKKEANRKGQY